MKVIIRNTEPENLVLAARVAQKALEGDPQPGYLSAIRFESGETFSVWRRNNPNAALVVYHQN